MTAALACQLPCRCRCCAAARCARSTRSDADRLLLVASDRVSAFDVVMREPVPYKGAVLTQLSRLLVPAPGEGVRPRTSSPPSTDEIIARLPRSRRTATSSPAARCWCAAPSPCPSSAWCAATSPARPGRSTSSQARWPASRCRRACCESARLDPPLFSPATKAETGHDENVTFAAVAQALGADVARAPPRRRASPSTRPGATTPPAAGHHHRRHQVRVRSRRPTAASCSSTRS